MQIQITQKIKCIYIVHGSMIVKSLSVVVGLSFASSDRSEKERTDRVRA